MIETSFFFDGRDVSLFGITHAPEQSAPKSAFVFSHPFGEEKLWSHRVLVSFARALAARGHLVMRFDYRGAGDSGDGLESASLAAYLEDIGAAVETLLLRHPSVDRVGLVGLRLGASIAALFAERARKHGTHKCLHDGPMILWDPVIDGAAYFQELLRSNLSTQLAVYGKVQQDREALRAQILNGQPVSVDGYDITKALLESCALVDLLPSTAKAHSGPTAILQIAANDTIKVRQDLQALAASYSKGTFARASEQPFWREIKPFYGRATNLQEVSVTWLEQLHV